LKYALALGAKTSDELNRHFADLKDAQAEERAEVASPSLLIMIIGTAVVWWCWEMYKLNVKEEKRERKREKERKEHDAFMKRMKNV
jgi:hypothetical protein